MRTIVGFAAAVATGCVLLAGCSDSGDLAITNDSGVAVEVSTGDDLTSIGPYGGVVLLEYGCTPGDVTLTFADDAQVIVPGPVCPPDSIAIAPSGTVTVIEAPV
ncbi:hypothetical protein [Demequina activiva]|uniref:Uncharacterized protein n=1 Tax=Demequina activiva TaxID=1582364 RepID=A0A919Q5F4_9MICO|nr:hypothetical protein [Demequina activiva]GIG55206.1 hypothetical protein Dac01nite_19580 [Demequina activiva]